ncbi:MAG: hypothetical protein NTX01_03630 [Candidatus Omnitrophica bacterium]|nr:hypothetical protein [Candidatus Omnitrophota bacterium]
MRKIINLAVLFIFVINMTGCATILKPKETQMKVTSEPEGAEIYQTIGRRFNRGREVRVGRTPATITLDNKREANLTFRKDGYEEITYRAKPHKHPGWLFASFACAIIPVFIDWVTHNSYYFKEREIKVTLDPVLPKQAGQINTKK